jgi:hypothetical protein
VKPLEVRRGCPRQEAASQKLATATLIPLSNDPLDDLAKEIDGSFVLVVKLSGGRYRRRCFLTVAAAERAAHNAQAAGHDAQVFLAELKPLWRLAGGTVAS